LGFWGRAFQSYQRAIRLGLNNFEIFAELGFLLTKTKLTHDDAIYCFEKAIGLDPTHEDLWIQYGDFAKEKDLLLKSMQCYNNALNYIQGEVKHREVSEKLAKIENLYDLENKSLFAQMVNESSETNVISSKH
jgi:tetratricopeptide (TPR) repeat protein